MDWLTIVIAESVFRIPLTNESNVVLLSGVLSGLEITSSRTVEAYVLAPTEGEMILNMRVNVPCCVAPTELSTAFETQFGGVARDALNSFEYASTQRAGIEGDVDTFCLGVCLQPEQTRRTANESIAILDSTNGIFGGVLTELLRASGAAEVVLDAIENRLRNLFPVSNRISSNGAKRNI
jgi:hypothetical protein